MWDPGIVCPEVERTRGGSGQPSSFLLAACGGQDFRSGFDQKSAEQRSMAVGLIFAVTTDREFGLSGQHGKGGDQVRGRRFSHLASVQAAVSQPARWCEGLGKCPGDNGRAGSQFGEPHVKVIPAREVFLPYASRRTSYRSKTNSLAGMTWTAEADNPNGHAFSLRQEKTGLSSPCAQPVILRCCF